VRNPNNGFYVSRTWLAQQIAEAEERGAARVRERVEAVLRDAVLAAPGRDAIDVWNDATGRIHREILTDEATS
jgi:hypothetical protein